jgi:Flp pilus assembly pilin Flp
MAFFKSFWRDEQAQDVIEYALLMAFVLLASAGLLLSFGGSIAGIWSQSATSLASANASTI